MTAFDVISFCFKSTMTHNPRWWHDKNTLKWLYRHQMIGNAYKGESCSIRTSLIRLEKLHWSVRPYSVGAYNYWQWIRKTSKAFAQSARTLQSKQHFGGINAAERCQRKKFQRTQPNIGSNHPAGRREMRMQINYRRQGRPISICLCLLCRGARCVCPSESVCSSRECIVVPSLRDNLPSSDVRGAHLPAPPPPHLMGTSVIKVPTAASGRLNPRELTSRKHTHNKVRSHTHTHNLEETSCFSILAFAEF